MSSQLDTSQVSMGECEWGVRRTLELLLLMWGSRVGCCLHVTYVHIKESVLLNISKKWAYGK